MNVPSLPEACPAHVQSSSEHTTNQDHGHPRRPFRQMPPAFKDGLRSRAIVLPTEDPVAFAQLRHELFTTYQPRTRDEANCVETMARCYWRMERCQKIQAVYDEKVIALTDGDPDSAAGEPGVAHHCETDPHRWQHKSMDCELQEGRLDRRMTRNRDKLFQLQWARRNHLVPGAIDSVADYRDFERAGEVPLGLAEDPEAGASAGDPAAGQELHRASGTSACGLDAIEAQAASQTVPSTSSDIGIGIGNNWDAPAPRPQAPAAPQGLPVLRPAVLPPVTPTRSRIPNRPAVLRSQTVPVDGRRTGTGDLTRHARDRMDIDRPVRHRPRKGSAMKAAP